MNMMPKEPGFRDSIDRLFNQAAPQTVQALVKAKLGVE